MNKGGMGSDLIGSFVIDLEDRVFGEYFLKQFLAFMIEK